MNIKQLPLRLEEKIKKVASLFLFFSIIAAIIQDIALISFLF